MSDHPWSEYRTRFALSDKIIYLLAHSLGPAPRASLEALRHAADHDWAEGLAASWNTSWMEMGARVGAKIAARIGATASEVHVCDSVTVNLFKLAGAAKMRSARAGFVIEADGFPTDSYALEGVLAAIGGYAILAPRDDLFDAITDDTAAVIATEVDFRSGARLDLQKLTAAARAKGALSLIDLSHSVGAVEVNLARDGVDLAVGCGYKYMCGGPGAPGFVYVADRWHGKLQSPLPGWMGHTAPFAFEPAFFPAPGARGFATGTPPILSLAALEAALDAFADIDPLAIADRAQSLGDRFDAAIADLAASHGLVRVSPALRGAHLAYRFADGFALKDTLAARGVMGDFRTPDIIRFGFSPLCVSQTDVDRAAAIVREVIMTEAWRATAQNRRPTVT